MALNPETLPGEVESESLYAGTFTTNETGLNGIDIGDYIGKVKVVLDAGAGTNDNQAANVSLQTGAEVNANFAVFDPAIAFDAIAANGAAQTQALEVDTRVAGKYLRAHLVRASAGNGRAISVTITGKKQGDA